MPPPNSIKQLTNALAKGLRETVARPTIYNYVPHEKQLQFHQAQTVGRLYLGGNRGGKTVGGTTEAVFRLLGEHPFLRVPPPPVQGRFVAVDFKNGVEKIIIPELKKWIPPSAYIDGSWEESYNRSLKILTLANGSTLDLMSYDQDVDKFAGTSRHFIAFDEDPPRDIFRECVARTVDVNGVWWITMTPVLGMSSFVYGDLYKKAIEGKRDDITVISVDMADNPYLSKESVDAYLGSLTENERKIRGKGEFIQISGLVFKSFKKDVHVINPIKPTNKFIIYASMDHGFNHPTVWLFHAVLVVKGVHYIITFKEFYQNETTIDEWAMIIHKYLKTAGIPKPLMMIADPATRQRSAVNGTSVQGMYGARGLPLIMGSNDNKVLINRMNSYLRKGQWFITNECPHLIDELQTVRWKSFASKKLQDEGAIREEIHKLNDDAMDASKYLFTFLPDIILPSGDPISKEEANSIVATILSANPVNPALANRDNGLLRMLKAVDASDDWRVIDEHTGIFG